MAFTVSHLAKTVYGNNRIAHMRVTTDNTSGTIETGLDVIDCISTAMQSGTAGGVVRFAINEGTSGTAIVGTIGCSGCTSGDEYFVTAFGR